MRLINSDALIQDLARWLKQVDPTHPQEVNAIPPMEDIIVSILMTIEEQPTIERKKGEWIRMPYHVTECSECGFSLEDWIQGALYNYCPNCGADMRGREDG